MQIFWGKKKEKEDYLFDATRKDYCKKKDDTWNLDSGFSNHMIGVTKAYFVIFINVLHLKFNLKIVYWWKQVAKAQPPSTPREIQCSFIMF